VNNTLPDKRLRHHARHTRVLLFDCNVTTRNQNLSVRFKLRQEI